LFERSDSTDGILRSEKYLTAEFEPENPVVREREIDRIVDAIKPVARKKQPENLLVHGPAGVGKTSCVKNVFEHLEAETRVKAAYINCWQYNTRPSLLTELLIQLGYPAPRKGNPVDELLSKLEELLEKHRGIAIALDEFDQLKDSTEIIYDLQMIGERSEKSLALVMVSNQNPRQIQLDPRSRSRLSCKTLQFKPYTAAQLEEILKQRVEQAFQPGAVPDEVIAEIAEQIAANNGDCRQALEVLLHAGRRAGREGREKVSFEDLDIDAE